MFNFKGQLEGLVNNVALKIGQQPVKAKKLNLILLAASLIMGPEERLSLITRVAPASDFESLAHSVSTIEILAAS